VIVTGSGFGGSVCALRLSEKGYRVAIHEQGCRFQDEDFLKVNGYNQPKQLSNNEDYLSRVGRFHVLDRFADQFAQYILINVFELLDIQARLAGGVFP